MPGLKCYLNTTYQNLLERELLERELSRIGAYIVILKFPLAHV